MIRHILFFILFFISAAIYGQAPDKIVIHKTFTKVSFADIVHELEKIEGVEVYYRSAWTDSLVFTIKADSLPLEKFLGQLLLNTSLHYALLPPARIYILPSHSFVSTLPAYSNEAKTAEIKTDEDQITSLEQKYLRGRRPDVVEAIIIGKRENARLGKSSVINGNIIDKETGEALIGATIYIRELNVGSATDMYGSLALVLRPGKYTAEVQSLGMADSKYLLDVRSDGYFSISMEKEVTSIDEVTVNAQQQFKRGAKVGLEKVSIKSIKELPTLMGEKDIIRISQMLPGIVSVGEGSAGINVRGGNADQNLFYINHIPIYNTSHLFGFFSAFNSSIIDNFSIYKGQVPAIYGGRLSSIFNIETRRGNKKKLFAQGGISPVSANLALEVPLIKDKCSVLLSARSTYSDWLLKRIEEPTIRNSSLAFYDFALGLNYTIDTKNQLNVFGYKSSDFFSLDQLTDYNYGNLGGSFDYMHSFMPSLKLQITGAASKYDFNTIEKTDPSEAFEHGYELHHYQMKSNLAYLFNNVHHFRGGVDVSVYDLNRGIVMPFGNASFKKPVDLGQERGIETSLFIDDGMQLNSWLNVYVGARLNHFVELGPKVAYDYQPGAPLENFTITDTLHFDGGERVSSYTHPEIRLALDMKINRFNSVKLSFTQMHQYLFMLSNTIAIAPNDQWKLADRHIVPPKSRQLSLGYYTQLSALGLSLTSEVYVKQSENIVEYKDGADFLNSPLVEQSVLQGDQDAYGLEFMLSKEEGKFSGWISYAYSRSFMTIDGANSWDKINEGKKYPSNYDKPHVLNVVANYKFNHRVALSSNVAYNTGRPVTLPKGTFYIDYKPYVNYSSRNYYRIPDYFRIDMSLTIDGNLKVKKPMHSYWVFSVYNLLGRKNVNSIYFRSSKNQLEGYQYSVIGTPIFTISWNFKLGNYVND